MMDNFHHKQSNLANQASYTSKNYRQKSVFKIIIFFIGELKLQTLKILQKIKKLFSLVSVRLIFISQVKA